MHQSFILFFIAIVCCLVILCFTYFFIYKKVKINLQHIISFGAGFLTIFILFDFIPYALHIGVDIKKSIFFIFLGLIVNAFAEFIILPRITFLNSLLPKKNHDCHQHHHLMPSLGCSAVGCFILCSFFDGFRLASAVLVDTKMAIMMGIGLLFHLLPEVISIIGIGLSSKFSRKSIIGIIIIFFLFFLGGYQVSFLLFDIKFLQQFVFSFTSGLLLYICFVHFIPIVIKNNTKKIFFISASVSFILIQISHVISHH